MSVMRFRRRDWEEIARRLDGRSQDEADGIRAALERNGDHDPRAVIPLWFSDRRISRVCTAIEEVPEMRV